MFYGDVTLRCLNLPHIIHIIDDQVYNKGSLSFLAFKLDEGCCYIPECQIS